MLCSAVVTYSAVSYTHLDVYKRQAITEAAKVRLRPILMTTAAMIAGLVPLLYATGAGAVSYTHLARFIFILRVKTSY